MSGDRLVWIDLETTGLVPEEGKVLEVACVITDNHLSALASFQRVMAFDKDRSSYPIDPVVLDMHAKNGLWDECRSSRYLPGDVSSDLLVFLAENGGLHEPLCGSTISFDRAWLKHELPNVEAALHYRNVDVTGFKIIAERMNGFRIPRSEPVHRALPDIRESIAALKLVLGFWEGSLYGQSDSDYRR